MDVLMQAGRSQRIGREGVEAPILMSESRSVSGARRCNYSVYLTVLCVMGMYARRFVELWKQIHRIEVPERVKSVYQYVVRSKP